MLGTYLIYANHCYSLNIDYIIYSSKVPSEQGILSTQFTDEKMCTHKENSSALYS